MYECVTVALGTALAPNAAARSTVVALTLRGAVYAVLAAVTSLPSIVYRIVAVASAQLRTS
jgi:hypothetical protein